MKLLALRTHPYPDGATASRRFESFCHYLHEAGIEVTLLALAPTQPEMKGEKYLHPSCRFTVIQVPFVECRSQIWTRIERYLSRTLLPEIQYSVVANRTVERAAGLLLKRQRFDCMLTTYPPLGSLIVADRISRRYQLPWIADLRDIPDEIDVQRKRWVTRRSVRLLSRACSSAAHLLTVSDPLASRLRTEYALKVPITTVYNGYEESDYPAAIPSENSGEFRITYCGSFGYGRDLTLLFQALEILRDRGMDLRQVGIHLYGVSEIPRQNVRNWRSPVGIHCHGMVPHREALHAQMDSAILMSLSSPNTQGILTSKIFEFAMVGRPVLSIPSDGNVLDHFVRAARIGLASGDATEIAGYIEGHLQAWRMTKRLPVTSPDQQYIGTFSRRAQAEKVVELMLNMPGAAK